MSHPDCRFHKSSTSPPVELPSIFPFSHYLLFVLSLVVLADDKNKLAVDAVQILDPRGSWILASLGTTYLFDDWHDFSLIEIESPSMLLLSSRMRAFSSMAILLIACLYSKLKSSVVKRRHWEEPLPGCPDSNELLTQ